MTPDIGLYTTHELKIQPAFLHAILSGRKRCEMREESDRRYSPADVLILRGYLEGSYTGEEARCIVTHCLRHRDFWAVPPGWVIMSIEVVA